MRIIAAIICITVTVVRVEAQTSRRAFEAASIKPSIGSVPEFEALPGGRLIVKDFSLSSIIFNAYRLRPYQIPRYPEWISSERYDIEAKADGNPNYNEMMLMLQNLLEDRFKLRVHWDMAEQPVFLITAAKGGIKLKPSTAPCVRFDQTTSIRPVDEQSQLPNCRNNMFGEEQRRWIAENVRMNDVTNMLSCECLLGRKGIDMTGFTGRFDFTLEFAADQLKTDSNMPSLLTVFQDQLGLKVESGRAPVEVLVIDHVERPTEN